jgi:hypothetical protein
MGFLLRGQHEALRLLGSVDALLFSSTPEIDYSMLFCNSAPFDSLYVRCVPHAETLKHRDFSGNVENSIDAIVYNL